MKIQNLAAVLLRMAALYFLYNALTGLIQVYSYVSSNVSAPIELSFLIVFAEIIIPLLGFVLMWIFPNSIAQLIVKPSNNESIKPMASIDWLRIIIISMGLYITIKALFDATYWVTAFQVMNNDDAMIFMDEQKASMITTVVEFIIGLTLISKNTWFSQALLKINAPEPADTRYDKNQSD